MLRGIYKEMGFKRPYYGSIEDQYNEYLRNHQNKQNRGQRGRDSERLKTYRAEWAFQDINGSGRQFESIEQVQKYINKITKSKTYTKLWLDAYETRQNYDVGAILRGTSISVAAKKRNGAGNAGVAYVSQNHIVLDTKTGMNEYTVLHELAHCLGHAHHGRSFRQALVKLVSRFMGADVAKSLKSEFKNSKLSYGDARKPMTFDQWIASKNRMEKMRNANAN